MEKLKSFYKKPAVAFSAVVIGSMAALPAFAQDAGEAAIEAAATKGESYGVLVIGAVATVVVVSIIVAMLRKA